MVSVVGREREIAGPSSQPSFRSSSRSEEAPAGRTHPSCPRSDGSGIKPYPPKSLNSIFRTHTGCAGISANDEARPCRPHQFLEKISPISRRASGNPRVISSGENRSNRAGARRPERPFPSRPFSFRSRGRRRSHAVGHDLLRHPSRSLGTLPHFRTARSCGASP